MGMGAGKVKAAEPHGMWNAVLMQALSSLSLARVAAVTGIWDSKADRS